MVFFSMSRKGNGYIFHSRSASCLSPWIQKTRLSTLPNPISTTQPKLIDTMPKLKDLLSHLNESLPNNPPSLYIDLEGRALSRHGSISIMQIFHLPLDQIYLVDVHTLGAAAFTTPADSKTDTNQAQPGPQPCTLSLKSILESPSVEKAFFDVRADSDALYAQYGIYLAGIQDIQLMELAARTHDRTLLWGLGKCILRDAGLSTSGAGILRRIKRRGLRLSTPERGGSYDVFNERPMSQGMIDYCALDVGVLPRLWGVYSRRLRGKRGAVWRERIREETRRRVDVCFDVGRDGGARDQRAGGVFAPASFREGGEGAGTDGG
ncbi:uncharacterized protein DSM5745_08680 [Aspergillus mulundensis]|uniref:3'-5' exonuclease domain-containing protein n=1 Tax=Aspergillus mulundensis TaxID=1810919 RepID=A0A3D8R4M1_9EURO|nr:hypothetical protein DSM5745_08680 [Aspergillus mulundensis]RDW68920.1 hypothetical protein DSM5745_08680 [Aspergillus mulundensis]